MTQPAHNKDHIHRAIALARDEKPAYAMFYPFLEGLFILQWEMGELVKISLPTLDPVTVHHRWKKGKPLIERWEFPLDPYVAEGILEKLESLIPGDNASLKTAHRELTRSVQRRGSGRDEFWRSFLHHEWEPWEEWVTGEGVDLPSLLFLARSCLWPSMEWAATRFREHFPPPEYWQRGQCPICGSLPALLLLEGQGERIACCSWCATQWPLLRLQCPHCDNRDHATLGYLYVEAEPHYHVHYCQACRVYFKQIDIRERLHPPFLALEEWITLHLDLLAQRAGYEPAPSVSSMTPDQSC